MRGLFQPRPSSHNVARRNNMSEIYVQMIVSGTALREQPGCKVICHVIPLN